jgi:formate hydrogenlyase transcriptional activator
MTLDLEALLVPHLSWPQQLVALARQLVALVGCVRVALVSAGEPAVAWVVDPTSDSLRETVIERSPFSPGLQWQDTSPIFSAGTTFASFGLAYRGMALAQLTFAFEKQPSLSEVAAGLEAARNPLVLLLADLLGQRQLQQMQTRLEREVPYLRDELRADRDVRTLSGDSPGMKSVRLAIQQVARTDSTVLILGETGTGKELVARAIHQLSPRRDRLLGSVNGAALAHGVVASELFGHEPGAFTGAIKRRIGRFELAHQGTLFLDEIAEITTDVQVMLLRVLQEKVIERVGGADPIAVDARLIAATHQDLPTLVKNAKFRSDLFYRLNVFPIRLPPLRERRDDLPDLLRHFLHAFNRKMGRQVQHVTPESLHLLNNYPWPGNVRELENLVERAMIVATGDTLHLDPSWLASPSMPIQSSPTGLREREKQAIIDALRECQGRIYGPTGAAARLGLRPTTLYGKMRRHAIPRAT